MDLFSVNDLHRHQLSHPCRHVSTSTVLNADRETKVYCTSVSSEAETPIVSSNGVQASKRHSHGNSPALRRMIKFVCETPVDQQSQPQPAIAEKSTDTLLVYPSVCLGKTFTH